MSCQSLAPLAEQGGPWAPRAEQLLAQCRAAGLNGIGFMHLHSHLKPDECLAALLDADGKHIGGLDITHAQQFPDAETMRMLREAVPYSWRHMTPPGRFGHKSHSDVNLRLPQTNPAAAMRRIWQAHMAYVARMEEYFAQQSGGQVAVYGHLNPIGIDPHNRITFACDDRKTYTRAVDDIHTAQAALVRELAPAPKKPPPPKPKWSPPSAAPIKPPHPSPAASTAMPPASVPPPPASTGAPRHPIIWTHEHLIDRPPVVSAHPPCYHPNSTLAFPP